jgi:hypothetical protein
MQKHVKVKYEIVGFVGSIMLNELIVKCEIWYCRFVKILDD